MQLCDLHIHSVYSDGTDTPAQILALAETKGLSAVALTDHNTTAGLPDFLDAAKNHSVEVIPGAEFSVDWEGTELHLLGLFLPPTAFAPLEAMMEQVHRRKEESNLYMIQMLAQDGYVLDYEKIKAAAVGHINRFHIAQALTDAGYAPSKDDAFAMLAKGGRYYREPERIRALDMIGHIRLLGGVPVLAHPLLNLSPEQLGRFLPLAKQAGMAGMECLYSEYDPAQTRLSFDLAQQFDLLPSGGSDYHGTAKTHIQLGSGTGSLQIPYRFAQDLKRA